MEKVLIAGQWRDANAPSSFQASNPGTRELLPAEYPVSNWEDCNEALDSAAAASVALRGISGARIADFLEAYANDIEANAVFMCLLVGICDIHFSRHLIGPTQT